MDIAVWILWHGDCGSVSGLEDFGYMENVTSVAQLKEQIVVTGAEV